MRLAWRADRKAKGVTTALTRQQEAEADLTVRMR